MQISSLTSTSSKAASAFADEALRLSESEIAFQLFIQKFDTPAVGLAAYRNGVTTEEHARRIGLID